MSLLLAPAELQTPLAWRVTASYSSWAEGGPPGHSGGPQSSQSSELLISALHAMLDGFRHLAWLIHFVSIYPISAVGIRC